MSSLCDFLKSLSEKGFGKYVEEGEKYCILYLDKPVELEGYLTVIPYGFRYLDVDFEARRVGDEKIKLSIDEAYLVNVQGVKVGEYRGATETYRGTLLTNVKVYKIGSKILNRIVINKETGRVEMVI